MSNESEAVAKIREMAKLSLLANRINETQEKNLKMFPLVFFNGVISAVIDYDFNNAPMVDFDSSTEKLDINYKIKPVDTKHFSVSYNLKIDDKAPNDSIEKRFAAIESAVRGLFWKDTVVKVHFNDILMYESKP